MSAGVTVTQADRDAANAWVRGMPLGLKMTLKEPHKLYQAFAQHRAAGQAELVQDAQRFRALMRTPRFRMFGAAGIDRETGERTTKAGWLHFGCEVWSVYPGFDADNPDAETVWGRHAVRALADAILEEEARTALSRLSGEVGK